MDLPLNSKVDARLPDPGGSEHLSSLLHRAKFARLLTEWSLVTHTLVVAVMIGAGLLLWLVNACVPIAGKIRRVFNTVVVLAVFVWLLYGFGVLTPTDAPLALPTR